MKESMGKLHRALGPPHDKADDLEDPAIIAEVYKPFLVEWEKFGLSEVCNKCKQLSTGHHCHARVCERCRAVGDDSRALRSLAPTPPELLALNYIERQLIATMKTSQHLLSLPSGGPAGQWGRMYVTALSEPQVCEVLADARVSSDGILRVVAPGSQEPYPARLQRVLASLRWLHTSNRYYNTEQVRAAIADLTAKMHPATARAQEDPMDEETHDVEIDYFIDGAPAPPAASYVELRRARGSADMQANLDARVFPHLFPEGVGGIDVSRKFPDYIRARLLGADPRFEESPEYIYFLLEYWLKKKVAGNTNVRIGPIRQSKSPDTALKHAVYTTMRDIPGTQPYMYTKRSMAISMFEQLGPPQWFLTLTCHARQPALLLACIYARLLREAEKAGAALTTESLRQQASGILHKFLQDEDCKWDNMTANQLCNAQPAVVARQFFHQVRKFMRWLAPAVSVAEDPQPAFPIDAAVDHKGGQRDAPYLIGEGAQEILGVPTPFLATDYIIRIEWQKRGFPHAHILLWSDLPTSRGEGEAEIADVDLSDDDALASFQPRTAEQICDKYICTTSPQGWEQKGLPVMQKLAGLLVHRHSPYCGMYTRGACRFGFPHQAEDCTRRKTAREQWQSRSKSVLAVRRKPDAALMGQYNPNMLLKWRGSMDLQLINDAGSASKYILGYTMKSEEDVTTARRVEQLVHGMTLKGELGHQAVYKAAHAALQGRTTSTFEACHLMLGLPVVQISRGNVWIQVGPPSTWVVSVPKQDEALAIAHSEAYRHDSEHVPKLPAAQR